MSETLKPTIVATTPYRVDAEKLLGHLLDKGIDAEQLEHPERAAKFEVRASGPRAAEEIVHARTRLGLRIETHRPLEEAPVYIPGTLTLNSSLREHAAKLAQALEGEGFEISQLRDDRNAGWLARSRDEGVYEAALRLRRTLRLEGKVSLNPR